MQSSGVGNCVNMFSLVKQCRLPCLIFVTMRGEYAEFDPWQVSMGSITDACLRLCGFLVYRIEEAEDVDDVVPAACDISLTQTSRLPSSCLNVLLDVNDEITDAAPPGNREAILVERGDLLVICGLGSPTYDVAAASGGAPNFYLWGAMGSASMVGLGLALARPDRRVAVFTGDGEMLMELGSLATIGVKQP